MSKANGFFCWAKVEMWLRAFSAVTIQRKTFIKKTQRRRGAEILSIR